MSDERWNDDVAYAFSTHRMFLEILGLWPQQTKTVITRIRWLAWTIILCLILPFLLLDFTGSNRDATTNIENLIIFTSMIAGLTKNACILSHQKKLGVNIDAAIDDWLTVKNDENARKIMKKYAFKTKILTFVLFYLALVCLILYILTIALINMKQIFRTDATSYSANVTADNYTTSWIFLFPCTPLESVTRSQFAGILVVQITQVFVLCIIQSIGDSFYFSVAVHLAGQLEILRNRFQALTNEPDTEANYRKKFIGLINRHSKLMEFNQNLEDSFNILLLIHLVMLTILLAMLGLRVNLSLNEKNHIDFLKSLLIMNYLFMQLLVYTYGGEYLQRESEGIFYALYAISWFALPSLMKDTYFAMMKSSYPFHLSGGKFFRVNREMTMTVLKTAVSCISVLRIML